MPIVTAVRIIWNGSILHAHNHFILYFLISSIFLFSLAHGPFDPEDDAKSFDRQAGAGCCFGQNRRDICQCHGARQGKKAILVFWATWCPHCYEELGTINDNFASIEQKGIKIILVDVGETKEDVKEYFYQRQMKLISFLDEDSVLQGPYHLIGVPTLIFIDEKGIIRSVTHEFPSDYEEYLVQLNRAFYYIIGA